MKLLDRVAIVTGASQGIGRAIAESLESEGALVVIADNEEKRSQITADGMTRAVPITVDVTDEDQVDSLINQTLTQFGRLDILVNNAGIYPAVTWDALTLSEWRRVMAVNLDGVFICSKAVYHPMREASYGRIINIASDAILAGTPNLAHYVASKGGVFAFTRALATELGQYGITANSVSPGLTETEGLRETQHLETFDWVVSQQAIPRRGTPQDIAPTVAFLASEAAGWITGSMIVVNGGKERY